MGKMNFKTARKRAVTVAAAALMGGFYTGHAIANLFYDGTSTPVQGVWWDYQDMAGMYQDYEGRAAVTAVGQPVGLVLDKRYGFRRGNETWNSHSVSFNGESTQVSHGVYRIFSSAGVLSEVVNSTAITVGKWYEVTLNIDSITTLGSGIRIGSSGTPIFTTLGPQRAIFKADAGFPNIKRVGGATDIQVSNITWKEVPGNHRTQSTTTARAILSALYNKLTKTEDMSNAVWSKTEINLTQNAAIAPDGTLTADLLTETTTTAGTNIAVTVAAGRRYKITGRVKKSAGFDWFRIAIFETGNSSNIARVWVNLTSGAKGTTDSAGAGFTLHAADIVPINNGFYLVTLEFTSATATACTFRLKSASADASIAGLAGAAYYFWGADLRTAADAALGIPSYQRVNTITDYDTKDFPLFIDNDGTDDSASSPAIDFSGTDAVTVFSSITNSSSGIVLELGTDSNTIDGSFMVNTASTGTLSTRVRGTSASSFTSAADYLSNNNNIITLDAKISTDKHITRVNGVQIASTATNQGNGNFGNLVLCEASRAGSSNRFNGRIYSNIVIGRTIDEFKLKQAEKYLARRRGLVI